jgi:DNA-binding CsgD family transcriptional regulator
LWSTTPTGSADCFGYLARRIERAPIALVVAARPQAEPRPPVPDTLHIGGLARESALELLHASAGELARPTADALVEATLGNPLALLELPRLLSDEQRRGIAPVDPLPAPDGVLRDAFQRRLAPLSPDARAALVVAAAASDRALAPVAGACDDLEIAREALEEAEAAALFTLADDQIAFAHPLLRAVAYDGAPAAERRRAHRALAGRVEGDARAWHLAAAAVGPDEAVAAALEEAAGRAGMRGAHSSASDAYERAARASEDSEAQGRRLMLAGLSAGLAASYERAAALLEPVSERGAPEQRAQLRHLLALVTLVAGTRTADEASRMLADEAERIVDRDGALAARLYADAALAALAGVDCRRGLDLAQQAAALVGRDAADELRCQVLATLGMALALRGRARDALDALDTAATLLPHVHPLAPSTQSIAFALHARNCTGQHSRLRDEAKRLDAAARDAGAVGFLPYYLLLAADAEHRLGDWTAAAGDVEEAVLIGEESGQAGALSLSLIIRARIAAGRGAAGRARADVERAVELAGPGRYRATEIWAHATLGALELSLGRTRAAIVELEAAERLCEDHGLEDPLQIPWAPDLVEAYAHAGRRDDARRAAERLAGRARHSGVPLALAFAARCQGIVAPAGFERHFERALGHHAGAGAPFEHARTLLAAGARLHRARRRVEARRRLREALAGFEQLGATLWAERARHELRAAGAVDRAPVTGPAELTAQERRIARAVARGATNREVAETLFLSPKTIEFHLSRVYRKLNVRSRVELATLAAEGRLDDGPRPL